MKPELETDRQSHLRREGHRRSELIFDIKKTHLLWVSDAIAWAFDCSIYGGVS